MKDEFNFEIATLEAALKEYLKVKYGTFELLSLDLDILWPWGTLEHKHAEIPVGSSDHEIAKQISIMHQGCMPYDNFKKSVVEKLSVLEDGFTLYIHHEVAEAIAHDDLDKIKSLIEEVNERTLSCAKEVR